MSRRGAETVRIDVIGDPAIQAKMKREIELKESLKNVQTEMRGLLDKKDQNLRSFEPQREKFHDEIEGQIDTLMARKDELHHQIDKLRILQNKSGEARDSLQLLDFEIRPLQKAIYDLQDRVRDQKETLERLETQRAGMNPPYKGVSQVDDLINKVDAKIAAATKANSTKQLGPLTKEKQELERAKKEVQSVYNLEDRIINERQRSAKSQESLTKKLAEKDEIEAKIKATKEKLDSGSKPKGGDFDKIRDELSAVQKKISALRDKRKDKKPVNNELTEINTEITALRNKRDAMQKEIEECRAGIPSKTTKYDPEFRGDIVGKGGATIEQLQRDFGVAIELDSDKSQLILVGNDDEMEACLAAIEDIVETARTTRQKDTVEFNPDLARPFIGTRGSNIEKMQNDSGAQIRLSADKTAIELTGTIESIEIAKKLIEEFKFNSCETTLKFDPAIREFVIGKGGATVRKIEKESGAKRINISSETGTLTIFGNKDAVAKAEAAYSEIINGVGNAFNMKIDERMTRAVIGRGGENIREIQDKSGAAVNINRGMVTIRGSRDAVDKARQLIEDIVKRDEIKIPYDLVLHSFLTTRPLLVKEADEDGNKQQEEELLCPLEDVKQQCKCDQVSAIRGEQKVVIRGRRESVNMARAMLEDIFRQNRPHVTKVPFPSILRGYFTKRTGSGNDRATPLDKLKLEHTGVMSIELNRSTSMMEIAGGAEAVANAVADIEEQIKGFSSNIRAIAVPNWLIGSIIGPGGRTIADLTSRTKTEIDVDREKNEVSVFSAIGSTDDIDAAEKFIMELKEKEERAYGGSQ